MSGRTNRQTDRHTNTLIAILGTTTGGAVIKVATAYCRRDCWQHLLECVKALNICYSRRRQCMAGIVFTAILSVCPFFRTIFQKPMQLRSPSLTYN